MAKLQTKTAATSKTGLNSVYMDVYEHPGHMLRRAQQIAVSVFYATVGDIVTPIQYSILRMVHDHPGVDQKTLAGLVALDTSTTATTAERLEAKGFIRRELHIIDRRHRKLYLTKQGLKLLTSLVTGVHEMQDSLFSTFTSEQRQQLMNLLHKFVTDNNARSRAPLGNGGTVAELPKRRRNPSQGNKQVSTS